MVRGNDSMTVLRNDDIGNIAELIKKLCKGECSKDKCMYQGNHFTGDYCCLISPLEELKGCCDYQDEQLRLFNFGPVSRYLYKCYKNRG
jgi:hypothetical protein